MPDFPVPLNEKERLAVLDGFNILDTATEQEYDDLVHLASTICETPIALISLLDEKRQWFKASNGIEARQTRRELAFCSHAILDTGLLVVPDALEDNRFANNALVTGAPHIRFYAGAPLETTGGFNLGTLCVIDTKPRTLTAGQLAALKALGRVVVGQLELRRSSIELADALGRVRLLSKLLPICSYCKRIRDDHQYWQEVDSYISSQAGVEFSHGVCPRCYKENFHNYPDKSATDTLQEQHPAYEDKTAHFDILINEELKGIAFVRDCVQLQFTPEIRLNIYTPVSISDKSKDAVLGDDSFANLMLGQLNQMARSIAMLPGEYLQITLANTATISVSLKAEDYNGHEALVLFSRHNEPVIV